MAIEVCAADYELAVDDHAVWLQTNRRFGGMLEMFSDQWEKNRQRATSVVGAYTIASSLVRMKPKGVSGFVNLDTVPQLDVCSTDGFITTNPQLVLFANPADCGEIAVHGYSPRFGKDVIALLHASRRIVDEGGHLQALDYLCAEYEVAPENLTARLSPSARVETYKFPDIASYQKSASHWEGYVHEDEDGYWHVDFHGRTVDDLLEFGIQKDNLAVSDIDTISHPDYYSNFAHSQYQEPNGANGLFFGLRS